MIKDIKTIFFSFLTFIIFLLYFFSEYDLNFIDDNLKNTYHRYKILTKNEKAYTESSYGKFSFINQINHEKYPTIRNRFNSINNFEFHPYWSVEKSLLIYGNNHPTFRISKEIEKYIKINDLGLFEKCLYYENNGFNQTQLLNINQNLEINSHKIVSITIKPEDIKDNQYMAIYSDNDKIADILLNKNDNWNELKSDYSPLIYNLAKQEMVIDSFININKQIHIFVFTSSNNLKYELFNIDSNAFLGLLNNRLSFESLDFNSDVKLNKVITHNIKSYPCHFSKI